MQNQSVVIDDHLSPGFTPPGHPASPTELRWQAHNTRVRAAAFGRRRMAACWAPTTRKRNLSAAKAEDSTRRYLASVQRNIPNGPFPNLGSDGEP